MPEKPVKCLVWDLDNTLWHGILMEDKKVVLRDGIDDLLRELDRRGILLSIASRNEYDDAELVLRKLGIWDLFLVPQIGWQDKDESLRTIARALNISIDDMAFIDDQEYEIGLVNSQCPTVRCYMPDRIPGLLSMDAFSPSFVTAESGTRRSMYRSSMMRDRDTPEDPQARSEFERSLGLELTIHPAGPSVLERCVELTERTHQLNSTGITYSFDELEAMCGRDDYLVEVVHLKDRYGDYGTIGLTVVKKSAATWDIQLLIMSCRVLSRGIGRLIMGELQRDAAAHQVELLAGFIPTPRNRVMEITYAMAGFEALSEAADGVQTLRWNGEFMDLPSHVKVHHVRPE